MKKLLFILIASIGYSQSTTGAYIAYQEAILSTAAQTVTVQQVANGTRDLQFVSATMWCTVATTFSLSRSGTAATATSATPVALNSWFSVATSKQFNGSDVGTGTLIRKYDFQLGQSEIDIDLSAILIPRNSGTTGNLTISTTSITGTCRVSFLYKELR